MFIKKFNKEKVLSVLSIFLCATLFGCEHKNNVGNNYVHGQDSQYMYFNDILSNNMVASEDGYYIASGMYLYYVEMDSMKQIILCNKPNCLHDKEIDYEKKYNCNAFLKTKSGGVQAINYYDENIYAISAFDPSIKENRMQLIKISKDGSKKDIIYNFNEEITNATVHRGYLYFTSSNFEEKETIEDDKVLISKDSKLVRVPINKKNGKPEVLVSTGLFQDGISSMLAYGNNIYLVCTGYEDEALQKDNSKIIKYDILSKKSQEILNDKKEGTVGDLNIYNGKLLYSYWHYDDNDERNNQLYICDLEGNNSEPFIKLDFFGEKASDDKYVYNDNIVQRVMKKNNILSELGDNNESSIESTEVKEILSDRIIEFYNEKGEKVDALNLGKEEFISDAWATLPGDNNYLFLTYEEKKNENEGNFYIKVVDKKDIGSKNIKIKDFFNLDLEAMNNEIILNN